MLKILFSSVFLYSVQNNGWKYSFTLGNSNLLQTEFRADLVWFCGLFRSLLVPDTVISSIT
jgi:hypothetical protein